MTDKKQATPPSTVKFSKEAFEKCNETQLRWLGNAGLLINSRGTTLMIDPMLKGFDMPLLIEMPIKPEDVPSLDAMLITHSDNDHYSLPTCRAVEKVCGEYHSTQYVAELMKNEGFNGFGHDIGDEFEIGDIKVKLTPAEHDWQNYYEGVSERKFALEDCCGFWIDTPDGSVWIVGDSKLIDEQLKMKEPKVILFDFSDNEWHIGLENAIKLANTYPNSRLILSHWGTVDAPDMSPFNADPKSLEGKIINSKRVEILAVGELFIL